MLTNNKDPHIMLSLNVSVLINGLIHKDTLLIFDVHGGHLNKKPRKMCQQSRMSPLLFSCYLFCNLSYDTLGPVFSGKSFCCFESTKGRNLFAFFIRDILQGGVTVERTNIIDDVEKMQPLACTHLTLSCCIGIPL